MLRFRSMMAGLMAAGAVGLTALAATPAAAYERYWHPHAVYYNHHHWVGPGYYYLNGGWAYYDAPFAYPPAVYPPAAYYGPPPGVSVVVPLHFR